MRQAIDANILIYAAAKHLGLPMSYPIRGAASARVISQRTTLAISECFIGEALEGASSEKERALIIEMATRGPVMVIGTSRTAMALSILLRRGLRRGDNARIDCLGYAMAALAGCQRFITYDKGFVGEGNRNRVPVIYRTIDPGSQPPECMNAQEALLVTNPRRRRKRAKTEPKDKLIVAWERRARAAARAAGATSEMAEMRFFCGTAAAYGIVGKPAGS